MLRVLLVTVILSLTSAIAAADSCSSIIAGARVGPSPTFRNWQWPGACYVTWPGGYINGLNARITYEPKCKALPGFLHFEGDYGSNRNTCVFSAPKEDQRASATDSTNNAAVDRRPRPMQAAPQNQLTASPPSPDECMPPPITDYAKPLGYVLHFCENPTDYPAALKILGEAREAHAKQYYQVSTILYSRAARRLSETDASEKIRNLAAYTRCMAELDYVRKGFNGPWFPGQYDVDLAFKRCNSTSGEFIRESISEIKRLLAGRDEAKSSAAVARATSTTTRSIDSRCLVVHATRETGVGCAAAQTWKMTHFSVAKDVSAVCPTEIPFRYYDETGESSAYAPTTVQTCGDPPLNVRIGK